MFSSPRGGGVVLDRERISMSCCVRSTGDSTCASRAYTTLESEEPAEANLERHKTETNVTSTEVNQERR